MVRGQIIRAELHGLLHVFDNEGARTGVERAHRALCDAEVVKDEDEEAVAAEVACPDALGLAEGAKGGFDGFAVNVFWDIADL